MRHRKSGRRLGRNAPHRKAMYRNMATSLLEHGRIRTTDAKAKELRKVVERLITLSKRVPPSAIDAASDDEARRLRARRVHAVRQARKWVKDRDVLQKLFSEYSEQFQDRPGGYTRITKIGRRNGDNAPMSIIELVEEPCEPGKKKARAPKAEAAPAEEPAEEPAAEEEAEEAAAEEEVAEEDDADAGDDAADEAEEAAPAEDAADDDEGDSDEGGDVDELLEATDEPAEDGEGDGDDPE